MLTHHALPLNSSRTVYEYHGFDIELAKGLRSLDLISPFIYHSQNTRPPLLQDGNIGSDTIEGISNLQDASPCEN